MWVNGDMWFGEWENGIQKKDTGIEMKKDGTVTL